MKKFLKEIKYDALFIKSHTLQPQWYKVLKVILIVGFIVAYSLVFGGRKTLIFCGVFFGLGLALHVAYRINTKKFTRSWLDFTVEEKDGQLEYQRIGVYYYALVAVNAIIAFALSQLLTS